MVDVGFAAHAVCVGRCELPRSAINAPAPWNRPKLCSVALQAWAPRDDEAVDGYESKQAISREPPERAERAQRAQRAQRGPQNALKQGARKAPRQCSWPGCPEPGKRITALQLHVVSACSQARKRPAASPSAMPRADGVALCQRSCVRVPICPSWSLHCAFPT